MQNSDRSADTCLVYSTEKRRPHCSVHKWSVLRLQHKDLSIAACTRQTIRVWHRRLWQILLPAHEPPEAHEGETWAQLHHVVNFSELHTMSYGTVRAKTWLVTATTPTDHHDNTSVYFYANFGTVWLHLLKGADVLVFSILSLVLLFLWPVACDLPVGQTFNKAHRLIYTWRRRIWTVFELSVAHLSTQRPDLWRMNGDLLRCGTLG